MSDLVIQASFNSGEWSPKLYARVDLEKYKSGAALLLNYFVDYRGGASTRAGTKYIIQCFKSSTTVRLIPFQASFNVGYVLEFGDKYIRFIFNGAPVLEADTTITGATSGPPEVFTDDSHGYSNGDWINVDDNYYIVQNVTTNTYTLTDLFGNAINTNPFTLPVSAARIYTIVSPYAAADLAKIKFAQDVNQLILCHPSYVPYVLTLITATNWSIIPIVFGTTAKTPVAVSDGVSFPVPGSNPASIYYSYVATSIDANGNESSQSNPWNIGPTYDLRSVAGSISLSWDAAAGAVAYNIYKSDVSYSFGIPSGLIYGFIGSVQGASSTSFVDSNISPDFSQTPPIAQNPFIGSGIASVAVTATGTYTTVPSVSATGVSSTISASLAAILQVYGTPTVGSGGAGYVVGDLVSFTNGVTLVVASVSSGVVTAWQPITYVGSSAGQTTSGSTPSNPVTQSSTSGSGTGATADLVWGVGKILVLNGGAGYASTPTITFSPTGATATATLSPTSNGNPSVCGFFQQRLVLASPEGSPQTFWMSQPGNYFNFNISNPAQASDAISGTLVSGQLNTIKSMIPQNNGLLVLTDRNSWLINGGSFGSAVSPSALVANAQSFIGASDVPPIVVNYDVLYVQAKGSSVRDAAFNIYANLYTGTDISVLSSHLFYGFQILEWAWAEEPFKLVWAVRNDGTMLNLTYIKEQDFIGWAHSTTNGLFKSVATVVEDTELSGEIDAIYTVVQRTINSQTVQYIERVAERNFNGSLSNAWCVDAAIQYSGAPATNFSGAQHLGGQTVTGLADGVVIPSFVMPEDGSFTLGTAASVVTVGLGYNCDLQTLGIDIGNPTIQGKVKKIPEVTVRMTETNNLEIGSSFSTLVAMKDTIAGNIGTMLTGLGSQIVPNLYTGDARTILDPTYNVPGQYCIRQSNPLPATILGVIPALVVGDD